MFEPNIEKMKASGDVQGLLGLTESGPISIIKRAMDALVALGGPAVEELVALMGGADRNLTWTIIRIISQIDDERCVEAFLALIKSEHVANRRAAISYLAKHRNERVIEALCWALTDDDGYACVQAMHALQANPDAAAVGPLISIARAPNASEHVQTVLRTILDKTPGTVSENLLRQVVQMSDSYVLVCAQVETSCTFTTYNVTSEEADFTHIKQMARQELIRRGLEA